jgi:hypothetical protein
MGVLRRTVRLAPPEIGIKAMADVTETKTVASTNESLGERAKAVVSSAYREHNDRIPSRNPIFTREMYDLLQEQEPDGADPLCLYRYFCTFVHGEWFVFGAKRMGPGSVSELTGESAEGMHNLSVFACLKNDRDNAECGVMPLESCGGMGLADIKHPLLRSVAGVELDQHYKPERLSAVMRRFGK